MKRYLKIITNIIKLHLKYSLGFKEVKKKSGTKILFIIPDEGKVSGGLLSIANMYETAKEFFPHFGVFMGIYDDKQKWEEIYGLGTNIEILNFKFFITHWIKNNSELIINVYEKGVVKFLEKLKKDNIIGKLSKCTLNILNQNQNFMPDSKDLAPYTKYFKRVTMTLAFKANETFSFPYLTHPPLHVGAYFKTEETPNPGYGERENLCILSDDENPFKKIIREKLEGVGIKCFDNYPIPYSDFVNLQKKAKWTISFGEGTDGYSMGQFRNGGIGFGVFQEKFAQAYFSKDDLPDFLFPSYDDMAENIIKVISRYDNPETFESENRKWLNFMLSYKNSNTQEKVRERWLNYYEMIGLK